MIITENLKIGTTKRQTSVHDCKMGWNSQIGRSGMSRSVKYQGQHITARKMDELVREKNTK
jgi:hypothetical protein